MNRPWRATDRRRRSRDVTFARRKDRRREWTIARVAEDLRLVVRCARADKLAKRTGFPRAWFFNRSHSIRNEIWLGVYDNPDVRLAAFFCEVGRRFVSPRTTGATAIEREAWRRGENLAGRYGVIFTWWGSSYRLACLGGYREGCRW